jgi:hypothetical protein
MSTKERRGALQVNCKLIPNDPCTLIKLFVLDIICLSHSCKLAYWLTHSA